jgi:hypothetical protein
MEINNIKESVFNCSYDQTYEGIEALADYFKLKKYNAKISKLSGELTILHPNTNIVMSITATKEIDDNTRVVVKVSIENDDHDESSASPMLTKMIQGVTSGAEKVYIEKYTSILYSTLCNLIENKSDALDELPGIDVDEFVRERENANKMGCRSVIIFILLALFGIIMFVISIN